MHENDAQKRAFSLLEQPGLVMMMGTVAPDGMPQIKAMVCMKHEGARFYFCSNTSTRRADELREDSRACLYAYEWAPAANPVICRGVMLSGKAELSWDDDLRRALWQDFMTMYYPQGPLDPDFVVVIFTAESGNYYEGLKNTDFKL